MASINEVLVKFKGDNSSLRNAPKESRDDLDGVKKKSDETDESLKKSGDQGSEFGEKVSQSRYHTTA